MRRSRGGGSRQGVGCARGHSRETAVASIGLEEMEVGRGGGGYRRTPTGRTCATARHRWHFWVAGPSSGGLPRAQWLLSLLSICKHAIPWRPTHPPTRRCPTTTHFPPPPPPCPYAGVHPCRCVLVNRRREGADVQLLRTLSDLPFCFFFLSAWLLASAATEAGCGVASSGEGASTGG